MTRITFVTPYALLGGGERYFEDLLTRIDGESIERIVVLQDGAFVHRLRELGFDPVVLPTSASKLAMVRTAWRLRRLLGRSRTIVHANGIKAALVAELASVGRRHRIIWVKHDFSWDGAVARAAAWRAHAVVGVSAAVVADIRHERLSVVSPGIEPREVDRAAARRALLADLGLDPDALLVALVGRLHPVKGHRELLGALPAIVSGRPRVVALFAGGPEPTQGSYAREIASESARAEARVHLLGHRADILDVIAACDVLVAPSVTDDRGMGGEAAGIVLLEAMSVGTPVVAYASGGIPEIVGDAGLLVPSGDRAALAEAIIRIGTDADLAESLRSRGVERVRSSFGIEQTVDAMRRIYTEADS